MIYTIGWMKSYDELEGKERIKLGPCKKHLGIDGPYLGGIAFSSIHQAKKACPEGYGVYPLQGDWESDVYKTGPIHRINKELRILNRVWPKGE